jgi:hypothetical protein
MTPDGVAITVLPCEESHFEHVVTITSPTKAFIGWSTKRVPRQELVSVEGNWDKAARFFDALNLVEASPIDTRAAACCVASRPTVEQPRRKTQDLSRPLKTFELASGVSAATMHRIALAAALRSNMAKRTPKEEDQI